MNDDTVLTAQEFQRIAHALRAQPEKIVVLWDNGIDRFIDVFPTWEAAKANFDYYCRSDTTSHTAYPAHIELWQGNTCHGLYE